MRVQVGAMWFAHNGLGRFRYARAHVHSHGHKGTSTRTSTRARRQSAARQIAEATDNISPGTSPEQCPQMIQARAWGVAAGDPPTTTDSGTCSGATPSNHSSNRVGRSEPAASPETGALAKSPQIAPQGPDLDENGWLRRPSVLGSWLWRPESTETLQSQGDRPSPTEAFTLDHTGDFVGISAHCWRKRNSSSVLQTPDSLRAKIRRTLVGWKVVFSHGISQKATKTTLMRMVQPCACPGNQHCKGPNIGTQKRKRNFRSGQAIGARAPSCGNEAIRQGSEFAEKHPTGALCCGEVRKRGPNELRRQVCAPSVPRLCSPSACPECLP